MNKNDFIAMGVSGALIYLAMSKKLTGVAGTAAVALGSVMLAKNAPVVSSMTRRYL